MSGIWWTKMEHKEDFCEHFCEMSDKEIVADIRKSINSFLKQRADGADFGAKMVKKALDRITSKHESAVANGSLGGQATAANKKKSPQDDTNGNAVDDRKAATSCDQFTADGDTREDSLAKQYGSSITRDENRHADALEPSANHYATRQAKTETPLAARQGRLSYAAKAVLMRPPPSPIICGNPRRPGTTAKAAAMHSRRAVPKTATFTTKNPQ